jgi:uncharacterized protein HemY
MKNIFLFVLIVILAIAGMIFAQEQSHVDFAYGDWTVTLKAWLVVLGLIVFIIGYKVIVGSICWFIHLPKRWGSYRQTQRDSQDQENQQAHKNALANLKNTQDLTELNEQWNIISQRLRQNPEFAAVYVDKALHFGGEVAAASVIEWQLSRQWQPLFINYYGLLKQNSTARVKEVEHWLRQHSNDAALLLAAARLSMQTEEWGKAEQYLQQSITQQPSVAAYLELAAVQQQLGKTELSLRSYQMARTLQREVV